MDEADQASKDVERELLIALSNHKTKLEESGIIYCEDCNILIPAKRKKAIPSCTRCVDCQELI